MIQLNWLSRQVSSPSLPLICMCLAKKVMFPVEENCSLLKHSLLGPPNKGWDNYSKVSSQSVLFYFPCFGSIIFWNLCLSWSVRIRLLFSQLDIQWPSIIHCISLLPEFESNNSVFVGLFMDPLFCFIWLLVYPCSILHYCNYYNLLSDNIVGYHCISAEQAGYSLL